MAEILTQTVKCVARLCVGFLLCLVAAQWPFPSAAQSGTSKKETPQEQANGPKPATEPTKKANAEFARPLPFADKRDFDNARKSFIVPLLNKGIVKNDKGVVAGDSADFVFPLDAAPPDMVNPSLWRQAQFNGITGLFKFADRIDQVRGADILPRTDTSNIGDGLGVELNNGSACPEPKPYALLRQDDDYSYLSDPACRKAFWDRLKLIPLNSKGDVSLSVGGEIREWYASFRNANFGIGPQDDDGFLLQRITLFGDLHLGDKVRFFGQLTSDIEAGRNGGPQPNDEDRLWFEQLFMDIKAIESNGNSLTLRLGRQEFEFGGGRLVDVREGPNVRLAFDGFDAIVKTGAWHVDAFIARPVINNIGVFDDHSDRNTLFWGVYGVTPLPVTRGGNIDVFYLGIDKDQATFNRGTAEEIRHTVGSRFWGVRDAWGYDWEGQLQFGSFGNADIFAWAFTGNTGYTFRSVSLQPQLNIRWSATSGDGPPGSDTLGTLNPLFPSGSYFGEGVVNLNGPSNMLRIGTSLRLHPTDTVSVVADYDLFWRESLDDGVYGLGVNLLRSGQANRDRYFGSQPSVGVYWQATRHLSLSASYTHFFVGPFFTNGPSPGRSVDNVAIWTTYKF